MQTNTCFTCRLFNYDLVTLLKNVKAPLYGMDSVRVYVEIFEGREDKFNGSMKFYINACSMYTASTT